MLNRRCDSRLSTESKKRFAYSRRHPDHRAFQNAANRIAAALRLFYARFHVFGRQITETGQITISQLQQLISQRFLVLRQRLIADVLDPQYMRPDQNSSGFQHLQKNGAGSDQRRRDPAEKCPPPR